MKKETIILEDKIYIEQSNHWGCTIFADLNAANSDANKVVKFTQCGHTVVVEKSKLPELVAFLKNLI